jgi:hypothetical protein
MLLLLLPHPLHTSLPAPEHHLLLPLQPYCQSQSSLRWMIFGLSLLSCQLHQHQNRYPVLPLLLPPQLLLPQQLPQAWPLSLGH